MEYYTATFDPRPKLRPPTLDEFMAADEEIWSGRCGILTLVNEASWTLEQAIFDMLHPATIWIVYWVESEMARPHRS